MIKFAAFIAMTALALTIVGFCNGITLAESPSSSEVSTPHNPFGMGIIYGTIKNDAFLQEVGAAWYLNWTANPEFETTAEFWPMLRVRADGTYTPSGTELEKAVQNLPGATWIIGNEPDIEVQDNASPLAFAIAFHNARREILARDSTAKFAIGAVGIVSPLRLAYLDVTLTLYRQRYGHPMPIDVWTIHHYLLPERLNNWGIEIPTGLDSRYGDLLSYENHDHVRIFKQGIATFRWWMKSRGFQDKPLVVTEFGLLLPNFSPQVTADYLEKTVSYLITAKNGETGYPSDEYKLVQGFAWFALRDPLFETGTLIQLDQPKLTPAGQRWRELFNEHTP